MHFCAGQSSPGSFELPGITCRLLSLLRPARLSAGYGYTLPFPSAQTAEIIAENLRSLRRLELVEDEYTSWRRRKGRVESFGEISP